MNSRSFALLMSLAIVGCSGGDPSTPELCDPEAPNTICTVIGNGEQGFGGDLEAATNAVLYVPQDTAISPEGELWVLDFNNYLIRAVDSNGIIRTVIGSGLLGDSPPVGEERIAALDAEFNHTTDLFFHQGYLYLAAWHNSRIKRVRLSDMTLENYAGLGRRTIYTGDDGPALMAGLDLPSSIALHPNGNLVIMDQANQVIRMIDQSGNISRIAGVCIVDYDFPCAVGEVPAACPSSNKLACGDLATECAKPCTPGYGGDGGSAMELRMAQPYGQMADPAGRLVYDRLGNLIFADTDNHRIRRIDPNGVVTTVAGTGVDGFSGDGGPGDQAQINRPVDVEAGEDGTVYFTDTFNNCIRKVDPAGIISTVVGQCSSNPDDRGFSGDGGPPLEATLNRPYGIDLAGNTLYVADSYNNRIRRVNL